MEVYEPIAAPRQFPALDPADRLHLELHGYVVVEGALTEAETGRLREAIYGLEARVRAGEVMPKPAYVHSGSRLFFRVDNVPHLDPAFLDHLMHPRLWGMAEEAIGGEARLEQSDVAILRPGPAGEQEGFGLHRGGHEGMAWTEEGLYHFPFVKTLTMLTDVGPDDGGTVVVPGSHRLTGQAAREVARLAEADSRLVRQVQAPAGSVLLFFESTVHGSGKIRSGRDRMFIVGGYTPPMYQPWHEYDVDPEWAASQGEAARIFLTGSNRWLWRPRVRRLADPVEPLSAAERRTAAQTGRAAERAEAERATQKALAAVR
jgi:hypothetical protein